MEEVSGLIEKMIDAIINKDDLVMRETEQTILRLNKPLFKIKEPSISDPVRYILNACIIKEMISIDNIKKNKKSKAPSWAINCPKLGTPYFVIDKDDMIFWEDEECNKTFAAHNIYAPEKFLSFY